MSKIIIATLFTNPRLKVLSGLFTNLTAGLIGAIFIAPNFSDLSQTDNQLVLILDIVVATISLLTAFWFEERSIK